MVSVLLEQQNILFAHVPRTGGGSISRALQNLPGAKRIPVRNMANAVACIAQLGQQLPRSLLSYRIVSVIRNPWDWTVSGYLHVTENMPAYENPPSFPDFVAGAWRGSKINPYPDKFTNAEACVAYHTQITQWEHLGLRGSAASSIHVCKFENFLDDVRTVLPIEDMPHIHGSTRVHYSRYYDNETQRIVEDRNADLIEAFGYQFEVN